jgi:hypothetical protein
MRFNLDSFGTFAIGGHQPSLCEGCLPLDPLFRRYMKGTINIFFMLYANCCLSI